MPSPESLRELDLVKDLLARLRLDRRARERGAVVTEGPTDNRILESVLGLDPRLLFPVGGRTNVIRCATGIKDGAIAGVVCLADRDFDADEDNWPDFGWLVLYDDADVEAMLFESDALDRFLDEWATAAKLERYGGPTAVRAAVRRNTKPLAVLRAANAAKRMGLKFDELEISSLTEKKDGTLKINSVINRLASHSSHSRKEIEEALDGDVPMCPHTGRQLARGRDLLAILTSLMRQAVGSLSKQQVSNGFVERSLRLASEKGDFDEMPFRSRFDRAVLKARHLEAGTVSP